MEVRGWAKRRARARDRQTHTHTHTHTHTRVWAGNGGMAHTYKRQKRILNVPTFIFELLSHKRITLPKLLVKCQNQVLKPGSLALEYMPFTCSATFILGATEQSTAWPDHNLSVHPPVGPLGHLQHLLT